MPGFPIAAVGAGLGQFAESVQKQREQQLREQQMRAQLENLAFTRKLQTEKDQAAAALFGAFANGGAMQDQGPGQGGLGLPGSQYVQQPGGGMPGGGSGMPNGGGMMAPRLVADASTARGPSNVPWARNGDAASKLPWSNSDPSPPPDPASLAAPPIAPARPPLGSPPGLPGNAPGAAQAGVSNPMAMVQSAPPEMQQAGQTAVQNTVRSLPPGLGGRMSMQGLAQAIDKANPNLPASVKGLALVQAFPLLAGDQRESFQLLLHQMQRQEHLADQAYQDQRQDRQFAHQDQMEERRLASKPGEMIQLDVPDPNDPSKTIKQAFVRKGEELVPARIAGRDAPVTGASRVGTQAPNGNSLISDDAAKLAAEQFLAGDSTSLQGWGRGANGDSNRVKIRDQITKLAKDQNLSGSDIAAKMAEFQGFKAGERTLGTREANLGVALSEARRFVPPALAASEKVDRTQFPTLNSLVIAASRGVGGEEVVRLSLAIKAVSAAYAQVLSRAGVPSVYAQKQADALLDKAYTDGQLRAGMEQMMIEIEGAEKAPGDVRAKMREGMTGKGRAAAAAPAAEPAAPSAPQGTPVPQESAADPDGTRYQGSDGKVYVKRGSVMVPQ